MKSNNENNIANEMQFFLKEHKDLLVIPNFSANFYIANTTISIQQKPMLLQDVHEPVSPIEGDKRQNQLTGQIIPFDPEQISAEDNEAIYEKALTVIEALAKFVNLPTAHNASSANFSPSALPHFQEPKIRKSDRNL
jgi:hypothetical protein